jgi:hypothetical protein
LFNEPQYAVYANAQCSDRLLGSLQYPTRHEVEQRDA